MGRELGRPDRKGVPGLKTVELGLTGLDHDTSVNEVKSFFDSIASVTTPKSAKQNAAKWRHHARQKEKSSATHFVIQSRCVLGKMSSRS